MCVCECAQTCRYIFVPPNSEITYSYQTIALNKTTLLNNYLAETYDLRDQYVASNIGKSLIQAINKAPIVYQRIFTLSLYSLSCVPTIVMRVLLRANTSVGIPVVIIKSVQCLDNNSLNNAVISQTRVHVREDSSVVTLFQHVFNSLQLS